MGSGASSIKERTDELIDNYLAFGASRMEIAEKFHCELNEDMIDEYSMYVLAIRTSQQKTTHTTTYPQ